jgi:hypothetical protein
MIPRRFIGISIIVFAAVSLAFYFVAQPQIIQLLESYVSSDGEIRPGGVRQLTYLVILVLTLLAIFGALLLKSEDENWRSRLKAVFVFDPFCDSNGSRLTPKLVLVLSTLIGVFLIIHIRLYDPDSRLFEILYLEDGVFESVTPILLIAAMLLLAFGIMYLRKDHELSRYRNLLTMFYIFLILIFFLYAMEEISWGQRIFGWETPQTFEGNVQDETNLHNYFNQYYLLFYRLLVFTPVLVLASIWMEMKQRFLIFKRTVLPHPSMLALSLLIALVSFVWYMEQELLEELFALFFIFYSMRIYFCFRDRGRRNAENQETVG